MGRGHTDNDQYIGLGAPAAVLSLSLSLEVIQTRAVVALTQLSTRRPAGRRYSTESRVRPSRLGHKIAAAITTNETTAVMIVMVAICLIVLVFNVKILPGNSLVTATMEEINLQKVQQSSQAVDSGAAVKLGSLLPAEAQMNVTVFSVRNSFFKLVCFVSFFLLSNKDVVAREGECKHRYGKRKPL